jgi:hypothetical protein
MGIFSTFILVCVYHRYCLHLQGEDGGSMDLRNVGILPQHYAASHTEDLDLKHHRRESFKTRIGTYFKIKELTDHPGSSEES